MSTQCPGVSQQVMSFTRPSTRLVPQATNTGAKRPGCEATCILHPTVRGAYKTTEFWCGSSMLNVDTHREAVNGEFVEEPLPV